jgi:hypothetical protein
MQVSPTVDVERRAVGPVVDGDLPVGDYRRGETHPAGVAHDRVGALLVRRQRGGAGGGPTGAGIPLVVVPAEHGEPNPDAGQQDERHHSGGHDQHPPPPTIRHRRRPNPLHRPRLST